MKIVIIGGGWAGCSAALAAKKQGVDVILIERTDMLLGAGLVGGIMRNNGRFTAAQEMIEMGGGDLFKITDTCTIHKNFDIPGNEHVWTYDVALVEPLVRKYLEEKGIELQFHTRVEDVLMDGTKIVKVRGKRRGETVFFGGNVFVDSTGTAGSSFNCSNYGNGCVMCSFRCPSFGPCVSIAIKAGAHSYDGTRNGGLGSISGAGEILKSSLSENIIKELNDKGFAIISVREDLRQKGKLELKPCQQYALPEFEENIILLDTGNAKIMTPFFPLELLRKIPGFENARYLSPCAGGSGNSVRFIKIVSRDNTMKVIGSDNLFCAGERSGLFVGHTEAIVTGALAGYNSACLSVGKLTMVLPTSLVCGDIISFANENSKTKDNLSLRFTFAGSIFFKRMKERGLYSVDIKEIAERVKKAGTQNIFNRQII